jgi:GH25 family lysozyme M1 (1,4-beta-N-acetylmuramidase)
MSQARIVDINVYYRMGGVDWEKLKSNFDAAILQAGVGLWANPLLGEHVEGAQAHGVPYMTYHIPNPLAGTMAEQVDFYLSLEGVKGARTCIDIEKPNRLTRCITEAEAHTYVRRIEAVTGCQPMVYTNPSILGTILQGAAWLENYWLWVAQYYYEFGFPLYSKYTGYEAFLKRYANTGPAGVRNTLLQARTVLWQFTDKGNAQDLCARWLTNDPQYPRGITDCDLNVSTIEREAFLGLLSGVEPAPEPPPAGEWYRITVADRNVRATPNAVTGKVLAMLHRGDLARVTELVEGMPGRWGRVNAYQQRFVAPSCAGYVYMNNLEKV